MFDAYKFIADLLKFSPRQLENETRAGEFLVNLLNRSKIPYHLQQFTFDHPKFKRSSLIADSQPIDCQAVSFASGKISGKNNLISSLSGAKRDFPFISFNPNCPAISASGRAINHPALAISKNDLAKILTAKKVQGKVVVNRIKIVFITFHQTGKIAFIFTEVFQIKCVSACSFAFRNQQESFVVG